MLVKRILVENCNNLIFLKGEYIYVVIFCVNINYFNFK